MASKNIIYKVTEEPTIEDVKKYDEDKHIFYRFQNPSRKLTSRSKSWGMIYSSAKEAENDGYTPLNGKSCTETLSSLMNWAQYYDNSYVVLVFEGHDTRETGDDGEIVATYYKKVAVWEFNKATDLASKMEEEEEEKRLPIMIRLQGFADKKEGEMTWASLQT